MRRTTSFLLFTFLLVVFMTACGNDSEGVADDIVGDEAAAPVETVSPSPLETDAGMTPSTEDEPNHVEPTPSSESRAVEEWLEIAPTFQGIAEGPDGKLYVGYPRHSAILVLSAEGELLDAWSVEVRSPRDLTIGTGTIYVADASTINRYDVNGSYLGRVGEFGFEPGQIAEPFSVAYDGDGNLFVTETAGVTVSKFSTDGGFLEGWADPDDGAVRPATFIESDSTGNLYLVSQADQIPFRVQVRAENQDVINEWDIEVPAGADDERDVQIVPNGLAIGPDDRIYVLTLVMSLDTEPRGLVASDIHISVYEADGEVVAAWSMIEDLELESPLNLPNGLTVTEDETLIIVDSGADSHRIQRFGLDGEFLGEWEPDVPAFLCELAPDEFPGLPC